MEPQSLLVRPDAWEVLMSVLVPFHSLSYPQFARFVETDWGHDGKRSPHCQVGQDTTGVLLPTGVLAEVFADYLLSN
jgi:hypothetical protein